jgi:hypothetical protein
MSGQQRGTQEDSDRTDIARHAYPLQRNPRSSSFGVWYAPIANSPDTEAPTDTAETRTHVIGGCVR